jgi:hypothetical protein
LPKVGADGQLQCAMFLEPVSQFEVFFSNSQGFDEFRVGGIFWAVPKQDQDFPGLLVSQKVPFFPCPMVYLPGLCW